MLLAPAVVGNAGKGKSRACSSSSRHGEPKCLDIRVKAEAGVGLVSISRLEIPDEGKDEQQDAADFCCLGLATEEKQAPQLALHRDKLQHADGAHEHPSDVFDEEGRLHRDQAPVPFGDATVSWCKYLGFLPRTMGK